MTSEITSGITVIQEAVLAGVPVIATATGGLSGYFPPDTVRYVPPGDVAALRDAILDKHITRAVAAAESDLGASPVFRRRSISHFLLRAPENLWQVMRVVCSSAAW